MNKHCWHETEEGWTSASGGGVHLRCCHCGATNVRSYRDVERAVPPHGRFFRETVREWDDIEENRDEPCEPR